VKHISRVVAAASVLALAVGATTATAASAADKPVLGFNPISMQIPAMAGIWGGFQGYAGAQGATTVMTDPNFDASVANQQITAWISNKQVNGLWAITTNPAALKSAVMLASSSNIPMVINATPADFGVTGPIKGIAMSAMNYNKFGAALGTSLAKCMMTRQQTQAVYIQGAPGNPGELAYFTSAKKAFAAAAKKAHKSLKLVATVPGPDLATAQTSVASSLQANPKAQSFLTFSDEGGIGAVNSLKAAGKALNKSCIVELGGNDQALAALKAKEIYTIAKIDFEGDLKQNIDWLMKAVKSPSTTKGVLLETPLVMLTK